MKRIAPLALLAAVLTWCLTPLLAAEAVTPTKQNRAPVAPIAEAISTITGVAISPLLGTGAYGAYQYFRTAPERRSALPWFAQASFFVPALLLVGACATKDAFGAVLPPGWKKPLDVMETIENKVSGLVAAGVVVPLTMAGLSKILVGSDATAATEPLLWTSGVAMLHVGAIEWSWLLNILTVPLGLAAFALVWMASHAINVLILLSPWGAVDAALKSARTALLGLLTISATLNPWMAVLFSVAVVVLAYFVAGWSFRLTIFGTLFCWDFFTRRRKRFAPAENDNRMFAGGNLPGVPVRTYGRLVRRTEGGLEFFYKPWLVLPERQAGVPPGALVVGRGLFFSSVIGDGGETFFLLPPRYHGHEETLVGSYGFSGVREAGLRRAWSVLKELFGGAAAKTQVV